MVLCRGLGPCRAVEPIRIQKLALVAAAVVADLAAVGTAFPMVFAKQPPIALIPTALAVDYVMLLAHETVVEKPKGKPLRGERRRRRTLPVLPRRVDGDHPRRLDERLSEMAEEPALKIH